MDDFMPSTVVVRDAEGSSNGKSRSFAFHILYVYAPTGHDLDADPPKLPTGTVATGEWQAYLLLSDDRRDVVTGWGLAQSDIETVLRLWLKANGLIH